MGEFFKNIPKIRFEGKDSKNPLSFKYYDENRVILGKTMKEHLPFAMAWWHNLCAAGTDMFGRDTADKSFGVEKGTMAHAKAKVDAGFEFMQKLGIEYFCFHDVDIVPEADDIKETNHRLDEISDYIIEKMNKTGIKCLWGTANMFSNPRFMNGAGSTNSADVYCFAAAQIKKALDLTVKLGGKGYVFWGGREGYETLLNTDMKFEQENIARLMKMAVEYGRSIGFKGDFYIEPKPKEPMKHQYDFDAATAIGFLKAYGLDKDFKMNIEANHATLAGHTFQHDLRVSAINGMLGSIDANQGDYLLGWDTDEFPSNVYEATMCMYEVIKAGGLTGGFNFDSKNRRPSYTAEDMFYAFILGMDTFALGLIVDTYFGMIIPSLVSTMGLFLMKQFMDNTIPNDLLEAARIDGAGEIKIFFRIVMPLLKPAWLTLVILSIKTSWGAPSSNTYREVFKTLPQALEQISSGGISRTGVSSAASLVMLIIPIVAFIVTQSKMVDTMGSAGLKG